MFQIAHDPCHLVDLFRVPIQASLQFLQRKRAIKQELESESTGFEGGDVGDQEIDKARVLTAPNPLKLAAVKVVDVCISVQDKIPALGEKMLSMV